MLINVPTKYYRQDKLESQCSLHSHSLPVTTGSDQTNTHCYSSYLYIRKLPTVRFELCKSQPMNNSYSYTSLCWPKLSSQSYTSPILRWTGNSPIWGKITAQTMGSSIYESPTQPTVRLKSPTKFTATNWWNYPKLTFPYRRATKRTIDRVVDHYIVPKTSWNIYLDTSETSQAVGQTARYGILLADLNLSTTKKPV